MKKIALIALVLILGVVGFVVLSSSSDSDDTSQSTDVSSQETPVIPTDKNPAEDAKPDQVKPTAPKTVTVTYSSSGFSPAEITINSGDTIDFINETNIPLWTASNPHPAHTILPEFDTGKTLGGFPKAGEGSSFTFDKVGQWGYHNHTAPEHTGVITVQ